MGQIDILSKKLLSNPERFADAINVGIYGGQKIVKPDSLKDLNTEINAIIEKSGQAVESKTRYRDILKDVIIKEDENTTFCIQFGIENQTKIDSEML
ncbi:MAG: hypothetical protein ACI4V7_01165, partial [Succinivibrionaceae bacterium]